MANAPTASTSVHVGTTLLALLQRLQNWVGVFHQSCRKDALFQTLMDLSDADLAKQNLQRHQIAKHVLHIKA